MQGLERSGLQAGRRMSGWGARTPQCPPRRCGWRGWRVPPLSTGQQSRGPPPGSGSQVWRVQRRPTLCTQQTIPATTRGRGTWCPILTWSVHTAVNRRLSISPLCIQRFGWKRLNEQSLPTLVFIPYISTSNHLRPERRTIACISDY